jgi:hypothetical protein
MTAAGAAITPELLAAARLKPDMVAATRDTLQEDTTAAEAMLKGE